LEGFRFGHGDERQKSLRGRLIWPVLIPPSVLGATYFLLIEYVGQPEGVFDPSTRLTLRISGAVIIFLSLVLAAAGGYLLADRVIRPLRGLLRLAETGELSAPSVLQLRGRGSEIHELSRLVSVLVSQNKAGVRALEELERVRHDLARLREDVARTGQHGVMPPLRGFTEGDICQIAAHLDAKRRELLGFFHDLHARVGRLREQAWEAGRGAGFLQPAAAGDGTGVPTGLLEEQSTTEDVPPGSLDAHSSTGEVPSGLLDTRSSTEEVRRLATVFALESARAGGTPVKRLSEIYTRLLATLDEMEESLSLASGSGGGDGNGRGASGEGRPSEVDPSLASSGEAAWRHLMEELDSLEMHLGEVEER